MILNLQRTYCILVTIKAKIKSLHFCVAAGNTSGNNIFMLASCILHAFGVIQLQALALTLSFGISSSDKTFHVLQVLFNTQPVSYTGSCTPVTDNQVGQSVIPPGTNIPTTATPPPQAGH